MILGKDIIVLDVNELKKIFDHLDQCGTYDVRKAIKKDHEGHSFYFELRNKVREATNPET